jgi:CRISPR/Cas system-associated protein Csm6
LKDLFGKDIGLQYMCTKREDLVLITIEDNRKRLGIAQSYPLQEYFFVVNFWNHPKRG